MELKIPLVPLTELDTALFDPVCEEMLDVCMGVEATAFQRLAQLQRTRGK